MKLNILADTLPSMDSESGPQLHYPDENGKVCGGYSRLDNPPAGITSLWVEIDTSPETIAAVKADSKVPYWEEEVAVLTEGAESTAIVSKPLTASKRTALKAWLKTHGHPALVVDKLSLTSDDAVATAVYSLHGTTVRPKVVAIAQPVEGGMIVDA